MLSLKIEASGSASWIIYGGCPARTALRESTIATERPGFAVSADPEQLRPGAERPAVSPFRDFWMISDTAGCNEDVEIGGLTYGYQYSCRVSEGAEVLYEAEGQGSRALSDSGAFPCAGTQLCRTGDGRKTAPGYGEASGGFSVFRRKI